MMARLSGAVALILLLSLVLACDQLSAPVQTTPSAAPAIEVPREGFLVLAELEPITLDPATSQESRLHLYITQIFSGLVRLN